MGGLFSTDSEPMGDLFSDPEDSQETAARADRIAHAAGSANVPRWPDAKTLLGDRRVASALRTAFQISSHPGSEFEHGGVISMHRTAGDLYIEFRTDREKMSTGLNAPVVPAWHVVVANFHTHPSLPLDLERHRKDLPYVDKYLKRREALQPQRLLQPDGNARNAGLPAGDAELPPSKADFKNAEGREILSLVVTYPTNSAFRKSNLDKSRGSWDDDAEGLSRGSVFAYGSRRRTNAFPTTYPGVTASRRHSEPYAFAAMGAVEKTDFERKSGSENPYDGKWQLLPFDLDVSNHNVASIDAR